MWPFKKKINGITPDEFLNRCIPANERREREREIEAANIAIGYINESLECGYTKTDIPYGISDKGKEIIRERFTQFGWHVEFTDGTYDIELSPLDSKTTE